MKSSQSTKLIEETIPFQNALYILEEGVALLNPEGIIIYINAAGKDMFEKRNGKSPKEGDFYLDFVHPVRKEATRKYIQNALAGDPHVFNLRYPQKKKESWFQLGYHPLTGSNGKINHVCVKAQEITEKIVLKKKLVKEKKASKTKLIKAILEAQERERQAIGRELHDNVNQVLATIKLYNEICLAEEVTNKVILQKSVQKLNYCITEIRRISHQLSSPALPHVELPDLLHELCDSVNSTQRIAMRFLSYGVAGKAIPDDIKMALYRIAQEQIANILKHSRASTGEIILVATSGNIALRISDNGIGATVTASNTGVGMISMRSRAESLGGSLTIETAPTAGFQLMVEMPFLPDDSL